MTETGRRMKDLLDKQVSPSVIQRSDCLADWYKLAQTAYLQTEILGKDIENCERQIENFHLRLSQESKERYDHVNRMLDTWLPMVGKQYSKSAKNSQSEMDERRKRRALLEEDKWKDICSVQEKIELILYTNDALVEELTRVASEMATVPSTGSAEEQLQVLATGS